MTTLHTQTLRLMERLGHDVMPFGVYYTQTKPDGYGPAPGQLFSREREAAGVIDWRQASTRFKCLVGSLWLARKKGKAAWISHEECGCMGGGYFTGMYGPYLERNTQFVSTGIPGTPIEGEHYLPSPQAVRVFLEACAPPLGRGKYCVVQPLEHFTEEERPLSVTFFARPEVLSGFFSLATYAAGHHTAILSPFGAGCTSIVGWPLVYAEKGVDCAILGGFDLSARKFLKTDELTFSIPLAFYEKMLNCMEDSALTRTTWHGVRKRVAKSGRIWGERAAGNEAS